ncbi:MAG: YceI family protein [Gammaproteobacteria bacterium]|uniref:YceI family protein n=1 Tax=Pseudomonas sp. TaxID=306 RepID=UPI001E11A251|nr:YceI family protein [Gammaproteobacteria bacterium]MBU2156429.1 YceI family protein [Gammaproteobacteria bacterium]MBU2253543.1 YceI family protein [Gammaproteobacteria bacterium]MBU2295903.1 YceI family protein [Gammaproteobacteria bacterium]
MLKKTLVALALGGALIGAGQAMAADYAIDKQGQHAFVNFKISHLGYSWLYGTFKDFDGSFSFDAAKPQDSKVNVTLNTTSVDTNHAERDKHIRSDDFLNVSEHPTATFASTAVTSTGEGTADITGDLTLNGVTKPVVIAATFIGEGKDPWGGYRAGFAGSTTLKLKDFGITKDLGPASESVELIISVEGVRK